MKVYQSFKEAVKAARYATFMTDRHQCVYPNGDGFSICEHLSSVPSEHLHLLFTTNPFAIPKDKDGDPGYVISEGDITWVGICGICGQWRPCQCNKQDDERLAALLCPKCNIPLIRYTAYGKHPNNDGLECPKCNEYHHPDEVELARMNIRHSTGGRI